MHTISPSVQSAGSGRHIIHMYRHTHIHTHTHTHERTANNTQNVKLTNPKIIKAMIKTFNMKCDTELYMCNVI